MAISHGCDINYAAETSGHTALHMSAANGHFECLKKLVDSGALLQSNSKGNTPLHWAVLNNHLECVKYLLEKFTDINVMQTNVAGKSALDEGFNSPSGDMLVVLLKHSSAATVESKIEMNEESEDVIDNSPLSSPPQ